MSLLDDWNQLPPGWWMSNRGPVSARGVLYETIPQGYCLADMQGWEDILISMGTLKLPEENVAEDTAKV